MVVCIIVHRNFWFGCDWLDDDATRIKPYFFSCAILYLE